MVSRLRWLTIDRLWALAIVLLIFFRASTHPITPNDFWWHLQAGGEIAASGSIPSGELLSYTATGVPYDNYAAYWLAEVTLYALYVAGGADLVLLVNSVLITLAYGMLMGLCRQVGHSWRVVTAATVFAALMGFSAWSVRPQAIALPLGAATLWAIYSYRHRPRPWLLLSFPLIMVVWANSHGSFAIQLVMLAIWLADEMLQLAADKALHRAELRTRGLLAPAIALVASILAALLNPRGVEIFSYVSGLSANPVIRYLVPEWAPPSLQTQYGVIFVAGVMLSAVILALSPQRPRPLSLLTFLIFAALGFRTTRGIVWFGIAMAPALAIHLAALARHVQVALASERAATGSGLAPAPGDANRRDESPPASRSVPLSTRALVVNYLLAVTLVVTAFLALPWFKHVIPLPEFRTSTIAPETPVAATEFLLNEQPPRHLFNDLVFGSYLIWAAQPDYPVFADPRLELYAPEHWLEYLSISQALAGWEERLDRHGVNTLMLSRGQQAALVKAAQASPTWREVYQDPVAVIFVRTAAAPVSAAGQEG